MKVVTIRGVDWWSGWLRIRRDTHSNNSTARATDWIIRKRYGELVTVSNIWYPSPETKKKIRKRKNDKTRRGFSYFLSSREPLYNARLTHDSQVSRNCISCQTCVIVLTARWWWWRPTENQPTKKELFLYFISFIFRNKKEREIPVKKFPPM